MMFRAAPGAAAGLKIIEELSQLPKKSRVKNRHGQQRKKVIDLASGPYAMRLPADFVDFVRRAYVVYTDRENTPTNPDLLAYLNTLTQRERQALIGDFLASTPTMEIVAAGILHGLTAGTNLSRQSDFIKASMMQVALGREDVCTYSLRFGTDFMARMAQRRSQTLTEVINRAVKVALANSWKQNNLDSFTPPPSYWHVIDYTDAIPEERGPGGFHIHGEIVACNGLLPYVREAMKLASNGYKSEKRYNNRIVHFGEPSHDFSNRGGRRENCLSDYPGAVRAAGDSYHFQQPWYCSQKIDRARAAGDALGVNIGNGWGWSRGMRQEAEACLGIFKVLTDGLHKRT